MELVEELAVGVFVKFAAVAKCSHRRPVTAFVRDVSKTRRARERPSGASGIPAANRSPP